MSSLHCIVLIQVMLMYAGICSHSNQIPNEQIQGSEELMPVVIGPTYFTLQWNQTDFGGNGSFLINITGPHMNPKSKCEIPPHDCGNEILCTFDTNNINDEFCYLPNHVAPCDDITVYVTREDWQSNISFNLAPLLNDYITPQIALNGTKMSITWDIPTAVNYIDCATRARVTVHVGSEWMNITDMDVFPYAPNNFTLNLDTVCAHGNLNATVEYLTVIGDYDTDQKFDAKEHPNYKGVGVTNVTTDVIDQTCSIIVSWEVACPNDVDKFIVFWDTGNVTQNGNNTIYTIVDVKADRYIVSVQAFWNGGAEMGNTIISESAIGPQKAPDAPTLKNVNGTNINPTTLFILWEKPVPATCTGDITNYTITYHRTGETINTTVNVESNDSNEYIFILEGLNACTSYIVSVAADWFGGTGEPDTKPGTTGDQDPGKPIIDVQRVDITRIGLRWDQPATESCPVIKYKVNWIPGNGIGNDEANIGNSFSYDIIDLICNKEYIIYVTAYTMNNKSAVSESMVIQTTDQAPGQTIISNVSAIEESPTKLNVTWTAPSYQCNGSSLGHYRVTWTAVGDDKHISTINLNNTDENCIIDDLVPCTNYNISVAARSSTGIIGLPPGTGTGTTAADALPVTNLDINSGSRDAEVTWKRPETKCTLTYVVEHSGTTLWTNNQTSDPGYAQTITDPIVTAALENLLPYSNYNVCVNVEHGELTCNTFITDPDVPSAPRNVSVQKNSITDESLTLTWQFPEEENGILENYIVLWSLGSRRSSNFLVNANQTNYTISGLDKGNYSLTVKAENSIAISNASKPIYIFLNGPWDQYHGPYDMIWNDEQCPNIGNHDGKSLSECMSLCDEFSECTAINYMDGEFGCILRDCPLPIPYPAWNDAPWQGYEQISDQYHGPYDMIWNDEQCPNIGIHDGKTLSECMSLCDESPQCTAINYMDGVSGCILRNCPLPIPYPAWNDAPWQGYEQISGLNLQKEVVIIDTSVTGSKAVCEGTCLVGIVVGILLVALAIPAFMFRDRIMNKIIKKRGFLLF